MAFILAMDYDGTMFDGFPHLNVPKKGVIDQALLFKKNGAEVVLWTCREGKLLDVAVAACKEYGLEFDAINSNAPSQLIWMEAQAKLGFLFAHHKIFANLYVDDRANGSIDYFVSLKPADIKRLCKEFD